MEINRHPEEELMKDMQVRQKFSRPTGHERCPTEEVKLAATAISLNVRLRPSDMPLHMQDRALRYTRSLLDDSVPLKSHPNPTHLARALKKVYTYIWSISLCLLVTCACFLLSFFTMVMVRYIGIYIHRSLTRCTDQRGTAWWERVSGRSWLTHRVHFSTSPLTRSRFCFSRQRFSWSPNQLPS